MIPTKCQSGKGMFIRRRRKLVAIMALLLAALPCGVSAPSEETGRPVRKVLALRGEEMVPEPRVLDRLDYPHFVPEKVDPRRSVPPAVRERGLIFCGEYIPLERADVLQRIEYQINYLLADFRDSTIIWLKRYDRYGRAVRKILEDEGLPEEFVLVPALESGFSSSAVSASKAAGWWQFVKPTAARSRPRDRDLDWRLEVNEFVDERQDLVSSTRAAARYLKHIRYTLADDSEHASWLTTAAAYNAGLSETVRRVAAYDTGSYWDMKLPLETEEYVPRWIALHLISTNREYYGVKVPRAAALQFETLENIRLERDLPLTVLADLTSSSVRNLRGLNSALRKGQTSFKAKRGSTEMVHTIHVPAGYGESVIKDLRSRSYLKDTL